MTKTKQLMLMVMVVLISVLVGCGGDKKEQSSDDEPKGILAKEKYFIAMKELQTIAGAVESYVTDNDDSPAATNIKQLQAKLSPFHIRVMPLTDPWGNPYLYKKIGVDGYAVGCSGNDRAFDGFDQEQGNYSSEGLAGEDIIYENGGFTCSPNITDPIK